MNRTAKRGGLTLGAAQLLKAFTQVLTILILARLLHPGDFGLVAAVAPLTSFILLFQDLGLQQMLVQRQQVSGVVISYVFWVTVLVGVACGLAMLCLSPLVAWFYGDPRLQPLAAAASVIVLGGSLCSGPMGMLNRAMRFGTMASIYAGAAVAGIAIAVATALLGGRYWALIFGPAGSTLVTLAGAWWASGLVPGPPRLRAPEAGLLSFGAHLTGSAVLNYFQRNLDNILVGRYVGSVALGYYDQAYKLLLFPIYIINSPLSQIMVPLLSRMQDDKARLRSAYLRVINQIVIVSVPGIAAATISASDLIPMLLGDRWAPVAPIFAWLGMAGILHPVSNSTGWLFISQGRTRTYLRWGAVNSSVAVASFFIGLPWGALGVAAAYAMSEYIRTPLLYVVIGRVGPVTAWDLTRVQAPPMIAALVTLIVMRWAAAGVPGHALERIIATFTLSYALTLALTALRADGRAALREGADMIFAGGRKLKARAAG
jgi:O-antigen/teichoic acid export membrane protein